LEGLVGYFRSFSAISLTFLLILSEPLSWETHALAQQNNRLQIRVLEGNNRILKKNESLEIVVEVREGNSAVPGAEVTFIAPEEGPGILFTGNSDRLTVKADARGRASSGRTRSIGGEGAFSVAIVAMAQGNTATASTQAANQTPDPKTTPPAPKKKSKTLMWILIAAGGGVAAALALKGSDSDDDAQEPPSITIGPPTVGAPE
jgi:hypothetical protein